MSTDTPTPPTNVRLVLDDDTEVPVDCAYDGMDGDIHRWTVLTPRYCLGRIASVKMDAFPAKTGIALALHEEADGV